MKTTATLLAPLFFVLAGFFIGTGTSTATAQPLRTVALSGAPAPGTSAGVNFDDFGVNFDTLSLNGAGQTAFAGRLTSIEVNSQLGIWSEGAGGGLALVARSGDVASGTAGLSFTSFLNPVLNGARTLFRANLTGTGVNSSNNTGLWSEGAGGGLALLAREGNQAPGTAGATFFGLGNPVLNDAGQAAFSGSLNNTQDGTVNDTNDQGIWSEGAGGGLELLVRKGNQAPGAAVDVNFVRLFNPVLNGAGQTAFRGDLIGPGVVNSNDRGIWSEGTGVGVALVAREGNAAPGTAAGANFSGFGNPVLNDAGQTAFQGFLDGPGVNGENNSGLWSEGAGGGLALVAREGNQAPGTSAGVDFSILFPPVLNGAGQTAFHGRLTGTGVNASNNTGLWSEGAGDGLALVAREGNPAPGTPAGVNFSEFTFTRSQVLNGEGQTAFSADLTGAGVNDSNDVGIWAEDLLGVLTLIVREGDLLDVDDGPDTDFRTISELDFVDNSGNEDGRSSGFNDLEQIAFRALFTDGTSGLFVSELETVSVPPGNLDGDFDGDGDVDGSDFLAWQRGESPTPLSAADLALWQSQFGTTATLSASASVAVPEPTTLALALAGLLLRSRSRSSASRRR